MFITSSGKTDDDTTNWSIDELEEARHFVMFVASSAGLEISYPKLYGRLDPWTDNKLEEMKKQWNAELNDE